MISARMLWTEYPYSAGFCITDDTDAATLEQTKAVYDFLVEKHFVTTKTVWPFKPSEPCGIPATPESTLRGITLENRDYFDYCKILADKGYEICLHSASAGNNKRQSMKNAFEFLEEHFGGSDTFILHSKNAENIYWGNKVTRLFPFNLLLRYQSKHKCYGEIENSSYFWGDICKEKVKQIRLYRTRHTNTLKRNPSMPYYDKKKPCVNYWFSATKRSISDCATLSVLDRLKRENGLTVLYQYLHRYADPITLELNAGFIKAVESISNDPGIHIATVSNHMQRLRMIRGIIILNRGKDYWIINANSIGICNLLFALSSSDDLQIGNKSISQNGNYLVIPEIAGMGFVYFQCVKKISFKKCNAHEVPKCNIVTHQMNTKTVRITIQEPVEMKFGNTTIPLIVDIECKEDKAVHGRGISIFEEYRLIIDQMLIIVKEILLRGRSLDTNKFLDASKPIQLENHDNW